MSNDTESEKNKSLRDFKFTEKYSYQYLDLLRSYKGKFDKTTKTWNLPESCRVEFMKEKEKIDKEFAEGRIEIIPFAFMRGRNFSNAFIILDEAQNITDTQMELAITRLCEGSKMAIVGDTGQIDLRDKKDSGLFFLTKAIAHSIEGVSYIHLKTNHRHPIVEPILEIYKQLRN